MDANSNRSTVMSPAHVTSIADAASNGRTSRRYAAPHGKNAAQQTNHSDSPYQERTSQKDNPTQALNRQLEAGHSDMLAAYRCRRP